MMKTMQMIAILVAVTVLSTSIECSTVKLAPFPTDESPSRITLNQDSINTPQEQEQIKTLQQESSREQIKTLQKESSQEEEDEVINSECNDDLITISKSEWGGRGPKHDSTHLEKPIKKIIIQATYTDKCTTQETCARIVRAIQTNHMNTRKWNDIGYNFLVGGDGNVYIGRGWNIEGAHTRGHNKRSVSIAFIGNFDSIEPPLRQLCAAKNLIAEGIEKNVLSDDYSLYGHKQLVSGTQSPGAALYQIIKTWSHWKAQVN